MVSLLGEKAISQSIVPAARNIKDFEYLIKSKTDIIILLDCHITQVQSLLQLARTSKKNVILHADLIQGLKHDEYGAQFLCQVGRPYGLISTHSSVVAVAKKRGLLAVQRVFLLDSHSLENTYRMLKTVQPDYIEVLPGIIPTVISQVCQTTKLPVLAGGFIRTMEDVEQILKSGASAITTSHKDLWKSAGI